VDDQKKDHTTGCGVSCHQWRRYTSAYEVNPPYSYKNKIYLFLSQVNFSCKISKAILQ